MAIFDGKVVVVTGGTGSFGSTMVTHLLAHGAAQVRIFSRDELKQDNLRRKLNNSKALFVLGDTRDPESMRHLFADVDYVFHAAALKQVPSGDFFPLEVTKTNVLGSANVIRAAEDAGVKSLVVLSTDKAVYPINAMGMSKALMEKLAISEARRIGEGGMKISVTRYGNVMMSRGSVIPAFLESATATGQVKVTSPNMTRFMMSLEESVDLVVHAMLRGSQGSLLVKKSKAASIRSLVNAVSKIVGKDLEEIGIGIRHGEKLHETLVSREEMTKSIDRGQFLEIPMDDRELNYDSFFESGDVVETMPVAYSSQNAEQIESDDLAKLITSLPSFKEYLT